jgi:hypothetical protein
MNTPILFLKSVYPEYDWLPWKFDKTPTFYWDDVKNQRKFLDWAAKELDIKEMGDWYKVTQKVRKIQEQLPTFQDFAKIGGTSLLTGKYNNSPSLLLSTVYPEYDWLPWKFGRCPQHFWDDVNNQRKFMEWTTKELQIKEMSDWYKVTAKVNKGCYYKIKIKDFYGIGGSMLYQKYNWSTLQLISAFHPEYEWLPWKFTSCPQNYWDDVNNQKKFMEWAGKELKIKVMSDWYGVSTKVTIIRIFQVENKGFF